MRILVVFPEGNVTNNPHMFGLLSLLSRDRHQVEVVIPNRDDVPSGELMPGIVIVKLPVGMPTQADSSLILRNASPEQIVPRIQNFLSERGGFELVIGVDRGIIEAFLLARLSGVPHALISYEITFLEESSPEFKSPEIEACRGVAFAICQDNARGAELCRENQIPLDKLVLSPVAGLGLRDAPRNQVLKDALGIGEHCKVILYMGELGAEWSGVQRLLDGAAGLPEGWVIVLHHRYGNAHARKLLPVLLEQKNRRVFFSPYPSLPPEALPLLLGGVDLGAALYFPTFQDLSCGKNLSIIGLASGKFSTYLQHGVPVLVNRTGEMSDLVDEFGAGVVVDDFLRLGEVVASFESKTAASGAAARRLFEERFDVAKTLRPLLDVLRDCTE
jgi:glycosyltransferase involved in cell wall biosynthesis